jgi:hypothetical protein
VQNEKLQTEKEQLAEHIRLGETSRCLRVPVDGLSSDEINKKMKQLQDRHKEMEKEYVFIATLIW